MLTVKITAVHVPASGLRTSTWPNPLWSVPSSEYAATCPCGSNSVSRPPPGRVDGVSAFQVMSPVR